MLTNIQDPQPEHPRLKLTWDFFKHDKPTAARHSAVTYVNLSYTYKTKHFSKNDIKFKFVVEFKLDTAQSYCDKRSWFKDQNLLAHEQGHVDLGIIHARKLHKELITAVYNKENYKIKIESIFNTVFAQMMSENARYDNETGFSRNFLAQREWNLYFDAHFRK